MNKNYLTAMLLVFVAAKNPAGFAGVQTVNAQAPRIETNAVSEADIASNIITAYKVQESKTQEEIANAQIAEYQKALEAEKAKAKAQVKTVIVKSQPTKSLPVNLQALYAAAEAKYGVSRYVLAAVHMVESGQSLDTSRSSYAGAQGPMQFMPSTFSAYAQDGDADGQKLIYDVHDAVFTAAKYIATNIASTGSVTGALYRYNHSTTYVNHVLSVARSYGYAG